MALSVEEIRAFIIDTISPEEIRLDDEFQVLTWQAAMVLAADARSGGALLDGWEAAVKKFAATITDG